MTELLYSCISDLDQAATPVCAADYGTRITQILLSKTPVSTSENQPTPAEFANAFDAGTLVILKNITNGHRTFLSESEIEITTKEYFDKRYRVSGTLRVLSEALVRAVERYNHYDLYLYYITDTYYCFGGWLCSTDFSLRLKNNTPIYIDFKLKLTQI